MNDLGADLLISIASTLLPSKLRNNLLDVDKNVMNVKKAEKYDKIKEIIDDLGDGEIDISEDTPLVSASTAFNTVTEIWRVVYPEKREIKSSEKIK